MRRTFPAIILATLVINLAACNGPTSTNADSYSPRNAAEPAAAPAAPATPAAAPVVDKVRPAPKAMIPAGTKLRVTLLEGVSSDKSRAGDLFLTSLNEAVVVNGRTVLPKGTKVRGRVVDAIESGRVKGRASLELTLTQIVRDEGPSVNISTKPYTAVAEATKKRDAGIIGGAAGIGAAIGALAGGGKGAAIGAGVGAGAGTGTVLATKGKEIHYGPEQRLTFTLADSIEI